MSVSITMNIYHFIMGRGNKSGTQSEIDLIIELNGTIHPIEIKTKSNPDIHDIKNFEVLEKVSEKNIELKKNMFFNKSSFSDSLTHLLNNHPFY